MRKKAPGIAGAALFHALYSIPRNSGEENGCISPFPCISSIVA